jgi:hypothetical protein
MIVGIPFASLFPSTENGLIDSLMFYAPALLLNAVISDPLL